MVFIAALTLFQTHNKHPPESSLLTWTIQEHATSIMFLLYKHSSIPCTHVRITDNPNSREAETVRPLGLTAQPGYLHHQALGPSTEPASKHEVAMSWETTPGVNVACAHLYACILPVHSPCAHLYVCTLPCVPEYSHAHSDEIALDADAKVTILAFRIYKQPQMCSDKLRKPPFLLSCVLCVHLGSRPLWNPSVSTGVWHLFFPLMSHLCGEKRARENYNHGK